MDILISIVITIILVAYVAHTLLAAIVFTQIGGDFWRQLVFAAGLIGKLYATVLGAALCLLLVGVGVYAVVFGIVGWLTP